MSLTKQATVWCDDCATWEQASMTARSLRAELRRRGWTRGKDGKDYCPACSAANARTHAAITGLLAAVEKAYVEELNDDVVREVIADENKSKN